MESKTILQACVLGTVVLCGVTFANAQTRVYPDPVPAERSYLCFDGGSASEVMKKANEAGARGWKMVAASAQHGQTIWCFEQLTSARPTASK